ncbi:MAG: hypothetical protein ACKPKO_35250, partial [Candidatus Fonsibacter sp.]
VLVASRSRRDSRQGNGFPDVFKATWVVRFAHLLHIFLERKITALPRILDEIYEQLGVNMVLTATTSVRVCGSYTRTIFQGTFLSTSFSILIGQPFGRTSEFILKFNNNI